MHVPGSERLLDAVLKNRFGRMIVAALTCASTTLIAIILVPVELKSVELARSHVHTTAEVSNQQEVMPSDPLLGKTYSIQYRFRVEGQEYYQRRPYGVGWSTLPKDEYDRVTSAGVVQVIYVPTDPWNSDLARNASGLRYYAFLWATSLVAMATGGWFWMSRVVVDEVRRILTMSDASPS